MSNGAIGRIIDRRSDTVTHPTPAMREDGWMSGPRTSVIG